MYTVLLERVFFRLGSADTDAQLSACINNFLVPVLQKLSSPHEPVKNKVIDKFKFKFHCHYCNIYLNCRLLSY